MSYFAKPTVSSGNRFPQLAPAEVADLDISAWDAKYNYWVHTGAGWKGDIRKTVVRFHLADDFMGWGVDAPITTQWAHENCITGPDPYTKIDERTYQWVYEDYEPSEDDDIQLAFDRPHYSWFTPEATVPDIWGAIPVMDRKGDEWWQNESSRQTGWEAVDADPVTAWDATSVEDHSMQVHIIGDQDLKEIRVIPGRNDTLSSFEEYGRPKTMRITLSDGASATITLQDEPDLQRFALSGTAEWARVEVLESYPGTRNDHSFVSEIGFGTEPVPEFEEFATLMTEQAPPTTGLSTTKLSTTESRTSSTIEPVPTGLPRSTATSAASLTHIAATQVDEEAERARWPVYVGIAVILAAAMVAAMLVLELRRANRQS